MNRGALLIGIFEQAGRMEFVRGAQSTLYGSDAITSVARSGRTGNTLTPELRFGAHGGNFSTANGYEMFAGALRPATITTSSETSYCLAAIPIFSRAQMWVLHSRTTPRFVPRFRRCIDRLRAQRCPG